MRKSVLFLGLLLVAALGGCTHDEDLNDIITKGTWRVEYFVDDGDERTSLYYGYVFTFLADGTVKVTRPGLAPVQGSWYEFDDDRNFVLSFDVGWPLENLDESWVVDLILDDEIRMHELSAPRTQLRLEQF